MKKTSPKGRPARVRTQSKYKTIAGRKVASILPPLLVVGSIVITATFFAVRSFAAVPPPPAGGYFSTLPVGSALPSEADCAARVHRSTWEPRPENGPQNLSKPTSVSLGNLPDYNSTANSQFTPRITGNFTGTTDEIIQWASCKWGFNDDIFRAQAVIESSWKQVAAGDLTSDTSVCPADALYSGTSCYQSYGLLQNKWRYNQVAYPNYRTMSAFHMDYSLMKLRACYEGYKLYLPSTYTKGDLGGCIGNWNSGGWKDQMAIDYTALWQSNYDNKPWLTWVDYGSTSSTADTTPPTAPNNLTGVAQSSAQIVLSWAASTDNVGVVGYDVFQNGIKLTTVANTSFSSSGLTPNTAYTYYVVAKDANANTSPASNNISVMTLSQPTSDMTAPIVTITAPSAGAIVGTKTSISASATDSVGVVSMKLYIDGNLNFTSSTGNLAYAWNSRHISKGAHTITVTADDATSNTGTKSITVYK